MFIKIIQSGFKGESLQILVYRFSCCFCIFLKRNWMDELPFLSFQISRQIGNPVSKEKVYWHALMKNRSYQVQKPFPAPF